MNISLQFQADIIEIADALTLSYPLGFRVYNAVCDARKYKRWECVVLHDYVLKEIRGRKT